MTLTLDFSSFLVGMLVTLVLGGFLFPQLRPKSLSAVALVAIFTNPIILVAAYFLHADMPAVLGSCLGYDVGSVLLVLQARSEVKV